MKKLICNRNFFKFTSNTVTSGSGATFEPNYSPTEHCVMQISYSSFSNLSSGSGSSFVISSSPSAESTLVQAELNHLYIHSTVNDEGALELFGVNTRIANCTFQGNSGSAIQVYVSRVVFEGNVMFLNNSALTGGGIQFLQDAYMYLSPHTSMLFIGNYAKYMGGAIYTDRRANDPCFVQVKQHKTVTIEFINNTADFAGSSLYSGMLACNYFFGLSNSEADPSALASDPFTLCFCEEGKRQPNCSLHESGYSISAYPGQDVPMRLAVVGSSLSGVLPGAIRAYFVSPYNASLGNLQSSQASDKPSCKNFNYSINTMESRVVLMLTPEKFIFESISGDEKYGMTVTVTMKDCPVGFTLSLVTSRCVCDPVFDRLDIVCDINDQTIVRPDNAWIGFMDNSSTGAPGVVFHRNCLSSYCIPGDVKITSNTSDSQCEPHRTGLLCGECAEGYSLTLGDGRCAKCPNIDLVLLLPMATAGLLLVVLLFALNITVAEGSINGLIFYANVVGMDYTARENSSSLYTFLAWLNLDFGIDTCFFDGMDGYSETWLQFAFPLYLWLIILVIIQFYRRFPRLANRFGGRNAVKVLATLLLLSYTKMQRTMVTIMSYTSLQYPDGVVQYVWLYDANVEFFKGKHLYLGIAGILILIFLILPYTLCLTLFPVLQAYSNHKFFGWVNSLKPIFDSYAGPFKDKCRFWTGMLLFVRTLLIILFTINGTGGSVGVNMLVILVVSFSLALANTNGVYKKWPYNYLDSFFYLQLGVFAGGVLYAQHYGGNITAVVDTSLGLTLLTFLAVVGYHGLCRLAFFKEKYYGLRGYADIAEEDPSVAHERI
jgi:predicted outer membrane repeat protein